VVDSYADLLADPEVDVVYNLLANAFHAPWNLAAIRPGTAVLSENRSPATPPKPSRYVKRRARAAR
jgi:hypothetical protein